MLVAITMRYGIRDNNREVYYILKEYKDICDKLDITLIPIVSLTDIDKISDFCDALIITGSMNNKDEKINEYNTKLDLKLIHSFYTKNKKILGICRGMQMLNIYFCGNLKKITNHDLKDDEKHEVSINKNSYLYKIYRKNNILVNSMHNYSVCKLSRKFKVIAISNDNIIEAIESKNILGVQWHPELMLDMDVFNFLKKERQN